MSIPNEVFENTSAALSDLIGDAVNNEDHEQPVSLGVLREQTERRAERLGGALNRFSDDQLQALREELDALVEEYGEDALAVRFVKPWAGAALSTLIEAGMDEHGDLTLADLFQAAERGLLARLIGEGEIDDDEAQTVLAELQGLVQRHGEDALAGDFIREP